MLSNINAAVVKSSHEVEYAKSVTQMLRNWRDGEPTALCELMETAYSKLSQISHRLLQKENRYLTLQTQSLIHEAYIRFIELRELDWRDREHFFSVWAGIMRRILIDRARAGDANKRGGKDVRVDYHDDLEISSTNDQVDILSLNRVLDELSVENKELCNIVELRYFAGLTVEEIALVLDVSPATVKRKWSVAQAWLYRQLS
jgi:RNA polymerase sigma factor (TIGR02999 family)